MKKKILAILLSTVIVFTTIAFVIPMGTVKAEAVTYSRDTTWYNADASILVIKDIPDFMEFMYQLNAQCTTDDGDDLGAKSNLAAISWNFGATVPFEGQTILLENDIVLNPGITFSSSGPSSTDAYCFTRSGQIGFGGIFDGQGHTISGIYIKAAKGTQGSLFGVAGAASKKPATNVTVKNLQIKNSYITSTSTGVASLFASAAFNANVRIENVYSCMHLNSNTASTSLAAANMGGFCATVGGSLTIDNSVYAGTMTIGSAGTTAGRKIVGGLVGMTAKKALSNGVTYSGKLTVSSSGYYGSFSNDTAQYMGKLMGQNYSGCTVNVKNSIFAGSMNSLSLEMMGHLIGCADDASSTTASNVVFTPMTKGNANVSDTRYLGSGNATLTGTPVKIAASAIKGDKTTTGLGNGLDGYWISNSDSNGYALPLGLVSVFTAESLKHNFKYHLDSTVTALIDALGSKKSSSAYTASSYSEYSSAYDSILASITKSADLGAINVATLKSNAEKKLVTVASVKTSLLNTLGDKKANNNTYTAASYTAYSTAYDNIVSTINSATSSNVESINVATLKSNAEKKLVTVDVAREELLDALGEKLPNDGSFSEDSYKEYSDAYDAIVERINSSSSVDIVDITVTEIENLKAEAESNLEDAESTPPEMSDIETNAPETNAPETNAPETNAPETSAPETNAPETNAPETNAPETSAPETNAPETSAPVTSDIETNEDGTSKPEDSESEDSKPEDSKPEESESDGGESAPSEDGEDKTEQVSDTASDSAQENAFGCGGSVSVSALALVGFIGTAVAVRKRKE